jgi:hypothetical protein
MAGTPVPAIWDRQATSENKSGRDFHCFTRSCEALHTDVAARRLGSAHRGDSIRGNAAAANASTLHRLQSMRAG